MGLFIFFSVIVRGCVTAIKHNVTMMHCLPLLAFVTYNQYSPRLVKESGRG